jgi:membrane dipeptidase
MSQEIARAHTEIAAILDGADVWDMTLPWLPIYWDMDVLASYHAAGYTFVSATLQDWPPTFDGTTRCVNRFKAAATAASDWLTFGSSLAEIEAGRRQGKLVIGLNSQETRPIGEDLSRIEALYALGVRHMLLAYNVRNLVADGCAEDANAGLSNYGRQVVREMSRVGMVVDCAHTGRRSSLEAIELSSGPVIFSHANPYAVCEHIRNVHDDQILACAKRGGVIGVVGVGAYLGDEQARTETVFRHIDYLCEMAGPQAVGLGTDYVRNLPVADHEAQWISASQDLETRLWPHTQNAWPDPTGKQLLVENTRCFAPSQLHELIGMMHARGYSKANIRDILGGNFHRVYRAAERQRETGRSQTA